MTSASDPDAWEWEDLAECLRTIHVLENIQTRTPEEDALLKTITTNYQRRTGKPPTKQIGIAP